MSAAKRVSPQVSRRFKAEPRRLPGAPDLLTKAEAAIYLNTSERWMKRSQGDGVDPIIPYIKIGHLVRWDRADLDAYILAQRVDRAS